MTEHGPATDSDAMARIYHQAVREAAQAPDRPTFDSTPAGIRYSEILGCRAVIAARDAEWRDWLTTTAGLDLRVVLGYEAGQREVEQRSATLEAELAEYRKALSGAHAMLDALEAAVMQVEKSLHGIEAKAGMTWSACTGGRCESGCCAVIGDLQDLARLAADALPASRAGAEG